MREVEQIIHANRTKEIEDVFALCERIGYGNVMDIASALYAIKMREPQHLPVLISFLTDEGKEIALQNLTVRVQEIGNRLKHL